MDWKSLGFYVLDRLKEPSTYAGILGFLVAGHISVDPTAWAQVTALGVAAASTAAVLLKEGNHA